MDKIAEIKLIAKTESVSGLGVQYTTSETTRTLLCEIASVSAQENFNGVVAGFRPARQVKLHDSRDYQNETTCEVDGQKYEIYRTYETKDGGIELYLQRRSGVIGY